MSKSSKPTMEPEEKPKDASKASAKARFQLALTVLPKIPSVIRAALMHVFGMSESSKYLNLKSDVIVAFLRSMLDMSKPEPIGKVQRMTLRDPGIKGKLWVAKVASEVPPEADIRATLMAAIDTMAKRSGAGAADVKCRVPDLVAVEAEWTGYRAAAKPDSKLPAISEADMYAEMNKECTSPVTIMYFHGGAYYLMDPSTYRPLAKMLAKRTGGRVYNVRYRLAPQEPFPSALLDALVSYFTLLYPPPGAVHEAVAPENIVFAGDSAGGNLSFALLQTLLEIRRNAWKVTWFGQEREVPLPAGVTGNSPWFDITQAMPSWKNNRKWDYLPSPESMAENEPPKDAIWPASPPRRHLFIEDAYIQHPLASLITNESWAGAPPVYICCGWECLADEDKYLAKKLRDDGVTTVFEEYEAMPHVFAAILSDLPEAKRCMAGWTGFMKAVCEKPASVQARYTTIKAKTTKEVSLDVDALSPFTPADLKTMADRRLRETGLLPDVPAKL